MPWVDTQQVCLNGHKITDTFNDNPTTRKDFCSECGAETITKCLSCGKDIPGETHYEGIVNLSGISIPVPKICQFCGNKFPWADYKKRVTKPEASNWFSKFKPSNTSKLIWTIFTGIAVLLAIFTDGFQVWDILNPKANKKPHPIINIAIEPIRINYSTAFDHDNSVTINAKIETGNGVYRFIDSLSIDTLILIDSSYFFLDIANPTLRLEKTHFDKMILGETTKEQEITLQLKKDFTLSGDKVLELYNLKTDKLIARAKISFPYYFDGTKFNEVIEMPLFVYRE